MRSYPLHCLVWRGLGLAAAAPGYTGRRRPRPTEAADLETVTVYARRLVPVTRVAATVTVITRADRDAPRGRPQAIVRYEPGLSVRNDPFRFGLDTISVRGLGGNRVAVEIDGIPRGQRLRGRQLRRLRAQLRRSRPSCERVEVLRGPASSLYGSDAIGGVVAMTTLAPRTCSAGRPRPATQAGYARGRRLERRRDRRRRHRRGRVAGRLRRREGQEAETAADVEPDPRDYTAIPCWPSTNYRHTRRPADVHAHEGGGSSSRPSSTHSWGWWAAASSIRRCSKATTA